MENLIKYFFVPIIPGAFRKKLFSARSLYYITVSIWSYRKNERSPGGSAVPTAKTFLLHFYGLPCIKKNWNVAE